MKREWGEDQWLEEDESMNKRVRELCSKSMHLKKGTLVVDFEKKNSFKSDLNRRYD